MSVDVVVGMQWGDEGKGKIIHYLVPKHGIDIIARYQGGPNAGHTIVPDGKAMVLHSIPSGIVYEDKINIIGNGCVVNLQKLNEEIEMLHSRHYSTDNLYVSHGAHIIMPYHIAMDIANEIKSGGEIGSTQNGITPAYVDKYARRGIAVRDFRDPEVVRKKITKNMERDEVLEALELSDMPANPEECVEQQVALFEKARQNLKTVNLPYFYQKLAQKSGKEIRMLAEGAQGFLLSIDHGTYPFLTSSNTEASGVYVGLSLPPNTPVKDIIGVMKAYNTRVGKGPFPTELGTEQDANNKYDIGSEAFNNLCSRIKRGVASDVDIGHYLRTVGHERGSTTGRPRRTGWHDFFADEYAVLVNGITKIAMTKLDVLDELPEIKFSIGYNLHGRLDEFPSAEELALCAPVYDSRPGWMSATSDKRKYDDLPINARDYVHTASDILKRPVSIISVGPREEETIINSRNI